jgi:hypothetical protein
MEKNFSQNKLEVFKSYYYPKTGSRFEIFNQIYEVDAEDEIEQTEEVKNVKTSKSNKIVKPKITKKKK